MTHLDRAGCLPVPPDAEDLLADIVVNGCELRRANLALDKILEFYC